jgi:pantoate--beta-alanine ligase
MEEIVTISALRARLAGAREAGSRVALVPTMGFLHEGHLALVDAARARAEVVVMSLFVNPLQFGPTEDFARYPRDLERDRALASSRGVDILFAPSVDEMYGTGSQLRVAGAEAASRWEGEVRPGHFDGVLTVVAKLLIAVAPNVACFGQKDIQQVTLIRQLIREFNFGVELVVVPIVREADGLALSSRNVYLSASERRAALSLSRALHAAVDGWNAGVTDAERLRDAVVAILAAAIPPLRADYIAIVDPERLAPVARAIPGSVIALAVPVGTTRLIDNVILGDDDFPRHG